MTVRMLRLKHIAVRTLPSVSMTPCRTLTYATNHVSRLPLCRANHLPTYLFSNLQSCINRTVRLNSCLVPTRSRNRKFNSSTIGSAAGQSETKILKGALPNDDAGNPMSFEISESAAKQLLSIYKRDNNNDQAIRIIVESGGCHGFQYKLDVVPLSDLTDEDILFEKGGAKVLIDSISLGFITGSKLDYTKELIGSAFVVTDNPKAGSSCGCGTSFEIKI
ncbi:hypothetical protein BKA69DRAFT_1122146 [Paraphysoderma sedebokerense]|nr:hypothetical protein BKA69DRAFT_1122146 [Paraphysoderma sedebokerense]